MIKLKKVNQRAKEEEAKKAEEDQNEEIQEKKQKKPPAELRLMKEVTELDLPQHAKIVFEQDSIMSS